MSFLTLENGNPVRGDLIKRTVLRSDAAPVPMTLEAIIRVDGEMMGRQLVEGKALTCNGDAFRIVKTREADARLAQGAHAMQTLAVTAFLDACHPVTFLKPKGILKEKTTLAEVYRACGAKLRAVDGDLPVPRFSCLAGGIPSMGIAQLLQEEAGIVRWKSGRLQFMRYADIFRQRPVTTIPDNASDNIASGFKERHQVPFYYSIGPDGGFIYGNRAKARVSQFVPDKDERQLRNMTKCLVRRKVSGVMYNASLAAGDLIGIAGAAPLALVTAVHVFDTGSDGSGATQYTRLFLYSLEE